MFKTLDIVERGQLGQYLNDLGMIGIGVEVGTHRGEFANSILSLWKAGTLYCVDPWENLPEYETQAQFLWDSETRDGDYAYAKALLSQHADRVRCVRMTSARAAPAFGDNTLDFVYLDGNHVEPYVSEDIQLWWPKVRPGGLLLGHDVVMTTDREDDWSVAIQAAVLKFAASVSRDVYLIPDQQCQPWSYCIHK